MKKLFARIILISGAFLLASCSHGGSSGGNDDAEHSAPGVATEKAVDSSGNEISIEKSGGTRIITSGTQATYTFTLDTMKSGPYAVTFTGTAQNASGAHIYLLADGSKKASVCPFDWSAEAKAYSFILSVPLSYSGESVSFNIEIPAGTTQIDSLEVENLWELNADGAAYWNIYTEKYWREDAYTKDFSKTDSGMSGTFKIPRSTDDGKMYDWCGALMYCFSEGLYAVSFEIESGEALFEGAAWHKNKDGTENYPSVFSSRTVSKGTYFGVFPVLTDYKGSQYEMRFKTLNDTSITIKNLKLEPYRGQTFEGTEMSCYTTYEYGGSDAWDINMQNIKDSSALPVIKSYTEDSITVVLPKDLEEDAACMEVFHSVKFPAESSGGNYCTVEAMVSGPADAPARMYNMAWYDNGGVILYRSNSMISLQEETARKVYSVQFDNPETWSDGTSASMTGWGGIRFGFWKAGTYTISSPKGYRTEYNTSAF